MLVRYRHLRQSRETRDELERTVIRTGCAPRPASGFSSRRPVVALAVLVASLSFATAGASEGDLPILGNGEGFHGLVLRASAYCPDPPAHLPAVVLRLELGEFESEPDPVTLEILASKDIRVELTVVRGGFESGHAEAFEVGPLQRPASSNGKPEVEAISTSMIAEGLQPAVVHFARALVLVGEGWVPTETTRFTTPICAVDGLDREEVAP